MPKFKVSNINWKRYFLSREVTVLGKASRRIESNVDSIDHRTGSVLLACRAEDYMDVYSN